ncbi:alpha/beta hydrolase [Paraglaciecola aquimarina]|uniref:Alpha/beta hydrolase n=1 Tax=Paraglaciecola algarum TaxID=3050085 RepID=A0ABS9D142_9ALTE|nr:alpha/beta hydrolase [Paraglaciecola sp. G1-23]MCF2946649.1 alpha/beta hydrolase [Paraglaciecola sp. G1-23]
MKPSILFKPLAVLLLLCIQPVFAAHQVNSFLDIEWAQPKGFKLTTDIYVPDTGYKKMPVLIIYHGGGWLLNTKEIMTDLSRHIAGNANIVVVNMNYRTLASVNNTTTPNEIINDAMGAVLWVKDNIKKYNGDPTRVAVTGDSAGGQIAAMVTLAWRNLQNDSFNAEKLGFTPSYLPTGKTSEQVAAEDGLAVQATILSYAAFDMHGVAKSGFEKNSNPFWKWANASARGMFGDNINVEDNPEYYHAVSPLHYIVEHKNYVLPPQFVLVGRNDTMTTPESAENYVNLLKQAGQTVKFKIYENRTHGFLDSGCPPYSSGCFAELAVPIVNDMITFLNDVFTPKNSGN